MNGCPEFKPLMMEYLDHELSPEDRGRLERHLERCPDCRRELEELRQLEQLTARVALADPGEEAWKMYWKAVYNRIERGIGWVLLSLGAVILFATALYHFFADFLTNPAEPLGVRLGISALALGGIVLFVSVLRERLFTRKTDRYKEIER